MLCQKCKKNEANTHVKSVVNGNYEEYMLCSECAKEMGYTNLWSDMSSDFGSILGSFFSNALPARSETTRCKTCGSTYHDIAKSGQVGCADCYELFLSELMPSIRRIHGNTTHCGKRPGFARKEETKADEVNIESEIDVLKNKLQKAIEEQNFELAAELRDKIKEKEESK
ncbi:MAG: UvrB/UvrC motif-containing protein [Ruminococcus sp.]|nr:UvrB/UvrC motif-containing protein [Ruminococcus sp.]